jgi:hypothetical protein
MVTPAAPPSACFAARSAPYRCALRTLRAGTNSPLRTRCDGAARRCERCELADFPPAANALRRGIRSVSDVKRKWPSSVPVLEHRNAPDAHRELHELAGRVRRLLPDWRDPERFFEARSEIAAALARLARSLQTEAAAPHRLVPTLRPPLPLRLAPAIRVALPAPPPPTTVPAPPAPRPRRAHARRHRFPRPPRLCPTQLRLLP